MTATGFPSDPSIHYYTESVKFELKEPERITQWLQSLVQKEQKQLGTLTFIFCSDEYLHQINIKYLQHDTLTDVISFPYSDKFVEGDIFISIDRILDNANKFETSFSTELHRVMAHGTLHLIGYADKSPIEKKRMTQKEDEYLDLLSKISV